MYVDVCVLRGWLGGDLGQARSLALSFARACVLQRYLATHTTRGRDREPELSTPRTRVFVRRWRWGLVQCDLAAPEW